MADPLAAGDGNDCSEFEWWREVAEGWIHRPQIRPWLIHRRQWLSSNDGDGDSGRQLLGCGWLKRPHGNSVALAASKNPIFAYLWTHTAVCLHAKIDFGHMEK
ncbi:hypothetical protein OsI_35118 [Oryza sativa Indica Group]|uniref:Uncharacterized protein n=1 Tax=Oryza sativa subsp. indica TaxID=39946 RepID=A2ZBH0_ORYSI|nr:hypothetical protein OsI_35118 [Oryza sativa Indica Group]